MISFELLPLTPYELKLKERFEIRILWNRHVAWFYALFMMFQTLIFAEDAGGWPAFNSIAGALVLTAIFLAVGVMRLSTLASFALLLHSICFAAFTLYLAGLGGWLTFQGFVICTIGSLALNHMELHFLRRAVLQRLKDGRTLRAS